MIYLFQSGAPSQLDLFDYKPQLAKTQGTDLPDSIRNGQRLTAMTAGQTSFPIAQSIFRFAQYGESRAWLSELLPYTAEVADDLCFIKSMHTEQINHDPAVTFAQTGFQLAGRPSLGAWVSYGLVTMNRDLPAFVVMITGNGQSLAERQWGTGFMASRYQGIKLRSVGDPVLYVSDPAGFDKAQRARFIDDLEKLNQIQFEATNNPEIATRIAQYEMAFRMQTSVPELTDLSKETERTFELGQAGEHEPIEGLGDPQLAPGRGGSRRGPDMVHQDSHRCVGGEEELDVGISRGRVILLVGPTAPASPGGRDVRPWVERRRRGESLSDYSRRTDDDFLFARPGVAHPQFRVHHRLIGIG